MNRDGRWGATLAFAGVVGAVFLLLLIASSPPTPEEHLAGYAVTMAVLAVPCALAAGILWRAWWAHAGVHLSERTGDHLSGMDAPARLLATAVATLPAERRDWGVAMTAELAQVPDRRARWRFAAGCARTAVFAPHGHQVAVLTVASLATAAVIVTGLAVGFALPAMRVFAVTFVVLVGAWSTVAAIRFRRLHRPANGPLTTLAGLAGVIACIAVTGYDLGTDASATLGSSYAITLAVVLAGYLWLTLAPPQALTTNKLARWVGLGVALALGVGIVQAARLNEINGEGILSYVLIPGLTVFVASTLVAAIDRSFSGGLQAAMWAVVLTSLLAFAVYMVEALRWYHAHQTSLLDGHSGGGNLHDAVLWILIAVPVTALPLGVIGAALGAMVTKARDAAEPPPNPVAPPQRPETGQVT